MSRGSERSGSPGWPWVRVSLAVLIGMPVLTHAVVDIVTARRVGHELGRLKASGAPVTLAEAAPPRVPNNRNAAVLYQKAFNMLPTAHELKQIGQFISLDEKERKKTRVGAIERIVACSAPAFALVEAASTRPACRFPVKWEAGFDAEMPHLAKMRALARLLAAKAIIEARHGDAHRALSDTALILKIGDHLAREPTLVCQLVRFACQAIAIAALNRVVELAPPSTPEARRMYDVLRQIDNPPPFHRAMQGERCLGIWMFDAVRRNPDRIFRFLRQEEGKPVRPARAVLRSLLARLAMLISAPFFNLDEVSYLQHMDRLVALSGGQSINMEEEYADLESEASDLPGYAILTRVLAPVYSRATEARDRATALLALAQHGMALRAYKETLGRYPDSLKELRQGVKWAVPSDPFSGRDLIYRTVGTGYLLYSIGPNMADDGGVDDRSLIKRGVPWNKRRFDIPWRMSR